MTRIAGYIHWGALASDETEYSVQSVLRHMTGSSGAVFSNPFCTVGVQGKAGSVAQDGDSILVLDGRLLDRTCWDDVGPGGDAGFLLRLCQRIGFVQALQTIEGDLSVAFFDASQQRLWLGRDRFGIKPLYYAMNRSGIAFASQPAALTLLDGVGKRINKRYAALVAGSHYRTFDNAPTESPYSAVQQIPAAHTLRVGRDRISASEPYWTIQIQEFDCSDEDELSERYRELLVNAVRRRLSIAHIPAFTLSGGMDSSSVLCSATHITGHPQAAFSSVYDDPTYDERNEINDVIEAGMAEWHPVAISNDIDLLDSIQRLVRIHNEPVATATWLSHDAVCNAVASAGFGALFGGLGGDELNAGEYEYFPPFFADLYSSGDSRLLDQEISAWVKHHDHPIHRKTPTIALQLMQRLTLKGSSGHCLPDFKRQNRYAAAINTDWFDVASFVPKMEHPFPSFLANRAHQDLFRETTPCCLRAQDRQCNAYGLEQFNPFLDRALAEFMFSMPSKLKIRDGVTKFMLRKATLNLLPDATRKRVKKTGWNAPAHLWFSSKLGLDTLRDLVASSRFQNRGLYNMAEVDRLITEHQRIVQDQLDCDNHMMFLWQLLNVECWLNWVDNY